jgi:hypothetical protein
MSVFSTQSGDLPAFIALVSTFWTQLYGGAGLVRDYLGGCMLTQQQLDSDINELVATISRQTCPLFHRQLWYTVAIYQSQGTPLTMPVGGINFPWPTYVKEVSRLSNGVSRAEVVMTEGVDYFVDPTAGTIQFIPSPFYDARFEQIPVFGTNGQVVDYKIQLWFTDALIDKSYVYEQFGYVIGAQGPSSQNYKDFVVAMLDAISGGTSYDTIARAISAIVDLPIVKEVEETVESIEPSGDKLLISTDRHVYTFKLTVTPIVNVGDVVHQNDSLVDAFYIFEPNRGGTPDIAALTLGPTALLDPSLPGPVTFNNAVTPLVVIPNVFGYTKLTWALGGLAADVTAFFDLLHTKGIAAGKTLAMCMDARPQPQPTQPTAANLPTTINPLAFLFQNPLRANAFVVRLKAADFGTNALDIGMLDFLRKIVPPHVTMIVVNI